MHGLPSLHSFLWHSSKIRCFGCFMFRRPGRARAEQTLKNATTQSLARPIAIPWQTSGCLDLFDLVFHDPWKLYINIVNWDFQQLVEDHYIHALRTWSEGWRKRLAALCTVPTRKTTATFPATMPRAIGSKQRWGLQCETVKRRESGGYRSVSCAS